MKKLVVGIVGKAGSGKDTIADYLILNHSFIRFSLADPLKAGIKSIFMLDDHTVYDRIAREQPLKEFPDWTVRKLLQFVGTELFRTHFDPDIWIKLLIKRINETESSRIVCSDIRFDNEFNKLKFNENIEFVSIKVIRPNFVGRNVGIQNHASEMYDFDCDITINNNGTIEDLYKKVFLSIEKIINKEKKQ